MAMNLPEILKTDRVNGRFKEILGKQAQSFISSLLTIYNDNDKLRACDPNTILAAAGQAANLRLPILPQLGYAYVIPYYDYKSKGYVAQFQLGYKGLIQLAMRSGLYRNLNSTEIYEGQIKRINYITGEIVIGERTSNEVVGYAAYMELINGFAKTLYMSRADIEKHAMTYSESYKNEKTRERSVWAKSFDTMAKKTVLKKLLTVYAPTSIEMQEGSLATALRMDQDTAIRIQNNYEPQPEFDEIDLDTGEVISDKKGDAEIPLN